MPYLIGSIFLIVLAVRSISLGPVNNFCKYPDGLFDVVSRCVHLCNWSHVILARLLQLQGDLGWRLLMVLRLLNIFCNSVFTAMEFGRCLRLVATASGSGCQIHQPLSSFHVSQVGQSHSNTDGCCGYEEHSCAGVPWESNYCRTRQTKPTDMFSSNLSKCSLIDVLFQLLLI